VGPIDESLCQIQLSSTTQVLGKRSKDFFDGPVANPTLKSTVARLVRRIAARQILPRRASAKNPQHAVQDIARVAVRPTTQALMNRLLLREKGLY